MRIFQQHKFIFFYLKDKKKALNYTLEVVFFIIRFEKNIINKKNFKKTLHINRKN